MVKSYILSIVMARRRYSKLGEMRNCDVGVIRWYTPASGGTELKKDDIQAAKPESAYWLQAVLVLLKSVY